MSFKFYLNPVAIISCQTYIIASGFLFTSTVLGTEGQTQLSYVRIWLKLEDCVVPGVVIYRLSSLWDHSRRVTCIIVLMFMFVLSTMIYSMKRLVDDFPGMFYFRVIIIPQT